MKSKLLISFIALFLFVQQQAFSGEGMWLPQLLQMLNEDEMQEMGLKLTAEDIYSVNKGSLKDAIAHFGGFCTSELISNNGLLLTNHHCGYGNIQSHSSIDDNILKNGFWAKSHADEKPNPGLFARFIVSIDDVSKAVLLGVTDKMNEQERQSQIDKNINALKEKQILGPFMDIIVRPFFKGNQYFMFTTETFNDVRLVGAPPESIGKFGSDTDNWVWPRHTGDFSLFRIYANKSNEPADYSADNVPYTPKHFLPISLDGVSEGDFTMIFGFPGRTNSYLPGIAVEQTANVINPRKIKIREAALNIIDKEMKADESIKIKYASKYASVANYWKKWIGESLGINKTKALEKKSNYETKFTKAVNKKRKFKKRYADVLPKLNSVYSEMEPLLVGEAIHSECFNRNAEFIGYGKLMNRLSNINKNNGKEAFDQASPRYLAYFKNQYKNYEASIDKDVFIALSKIYLEDMPKQFMTKEVRVAYQNAVKFVQKSKKPRSLLNKNRVFKLIEDADALSSFLETDPLAKFITVVQNNYDEKVSKSLNEKRDQLNPLMRKYMKAQMDVFKKKRFYPDANSTLRLTYGKVNGYSPQDALMYMPNTYLDGVIEKYKEGDYEFDVPKKLRDLHADKDYGNYAASNGKMPVCFIGTNHTTGGNSGSPAIDAHGNLIGLNFDRAWEGTMSDLNYDPSICRNIMVDARYILFIVDKFAGAPHLVNEMTLVHPKR